MIALLLVALAMTGGAAQSSTVSPPVGARTFIARKPCVATLWSVPPGVWNVSVFAWGAGGKAVLSFIIPGEYYNGLSPGRAGGAGAFVQGTSYVTPGETLQVMVGGNALDATCGNGGNGIVDRIFDDEYANGGGCSAISWWRAQRNITVARSHELVAPDGGGRWRWGL